MWKRPQPLEWTCWYIVMTHNDRILVADPNNYQVQVPTAESQFLASVGTKGKPNFHYRSSQSARVRVRKKTAIMFQVLNCNLTFQKLHTKLGSPQGVGESHYNMTVDSRGILYNRPTRWLCSEVFHIWSID